MGIKLVTPKLSASGVEALYKEKTVVLKSSEVNGGFTSPFDTAFYLAPPQRVNPTLQFQAFYIQTRVKGNLGGKVHEAAVFEHRIFEGSNSGSGQNASESSLVISGGANSLGELNAGVFNFKCEGEPSGEVEALKLLNVQQASKAGTLKIKVAYGAYISSQTVGEVNYSLYVPSGNSVLGGVLIPATKASNGLVIRGLTEQTGNLVAAQTSDSSTWFFVGPKGSVVTGRELSKAATDGFLYIPTVAGAPEGVPTEQAGRVPIVFDKTNNKLYLYNGAWKSVAVA